MNHADRYRRSLRQKDQDAISSGLVNARYALSATDEGRRGAWAPGASPNGSLWVEMKLDLHGLGRQRAVCRTKEAERDGAGECRITAWEIFRHGECEV